jgi:hypothetical protein
MKEKWNFGQKVIKIPKKKNYAVISVGGFGNPIVHFGFKKKKGKNRTYASSNLIRKWKGR